MIMIRCDDEDEAVVTLVVLMNLAMDVIVMISIVDDCTRLGLDCDDDDGHDSDDVDQACVWAVISIRVVCKWGSSCCFHHGISFILSRS